MLYFPVFRSPYIKIILTFYYCLGYLKQQQHQAAISKRNTVSFPDLGRIRMKGNFLLCPSLALFMASFQQTGIVSFFALTSALIGGNFLLSQNLARMFT